VLSQADNDDWLFELVPAVFGMGLVLRGASPGADRIVQNLRPYTTSGLLAALENNRIALFTRVLQMQYEAAAHADAADRLAEMVSAHQHEIERLKSALDSAADRCAAEVASLQLGNDRLRELLDQRLRPRLAATLRRFGQAAEPRIRKALHR
jgi:hypothetical protein